MKINTILFDLDNTLARCMIYFTFVRNNINRILSKESGLSEEEVNEIFETYERERVKKKDGFAKQAFLDSVNSARVMIYQKLKDTNPEQAEKFYESDAPLRLIQFTTDVYEAPYTIYEDVTEVLELLKSQGYSMYVVTKGDFYGQSRKASFIPKVFDGLFVLPHKSKYTWNGVLETTQVDRFSTVVVGDSVKDDINPALECGLKAIKMTREYTEWVGDPKTDTLSPVPEIHSLLDLIPELQKMQA